VISGVSCSFAVVVLEVSAKPAYTADRSSSAVCISSCLKGRSILQPLVRPLGVVVFDELAHQVVEMLRPAGHKVIEALLLQRLNEPFRAGVQFR